MYTLGKHTLPTLAIMAMAIIALTSYKGKDTRSLRGMVSPSSTRDIGIHASARRALLKTFVYANRKYHSRRLANAKVECSKVQTLLQDMVGCIYPEMAKDPSFLADAGGNQAVCVTKVMVGDHVLNSNDRMIEVITDYAGVLNADTVTFPPGLAKKYQKDGATLCNVKYGTPINMRHLQEAEMSDEGMTQEQYHTLIMDYVNTEVMVDCKIATALRTDENDCTYFKAAVDVALASIDLGASDGDLGCGDDPIWHEMLDEARTCDFVAENPMERCELIGAGPERTKARVACKESCNEC
mmetsp:Transcript_3436/g.6622  ORF Transcript_3436/g.6622 Transcript_3436/m.6622 type:complete len:297 (-) Transcript_3436:247-1137(-)